MNLNDNQTYNPAEDGNQGVVQLMAQGEESSAGISQADYINPVKAQGPEPEKAEVNESDEEGISDDILVEEDVENGEIDMESE